MDLWLPTYQRWEPLPYDAQFQEVATRYNLGRRQVEIGRYRRAKWKGVMRVSSDRRHSGREDQAPDLLHITEKDALLRKVVVVVVVVVQKIESTNWCFPINQLIKWNVGFRKERKIFT